MTTYTSLCSTRSTRTRRPRRAGDYVQVLLTACWRPTPSGKVSIVPSRASLLWRERVAAAAEAAMGGRPLLTGPVRVELVFGMPRPAGHYGTGRNVSTLKSSAPTWPTTVPDLDKLTRAVLDALTYTIVVDDSQVVDLVAHKIYVPAAETGCTVTVEELP